MNDTSVIELSQSALRNNIEFLRSSINPAAKIFAVVKANAYGHGATLFVPMLQKEGIHNFAVFSLQESIDVAEAVTQPARIMIMGWLHDNDLRYAIQQGFEFFVSDLDRARQVLLIAKELQIVAKIHLEVETGMNRTGLKARDLVTFIKWIQKDGEWVSLSGFCTHLAGAENIANFVRIKKQRLHYMQMYRSIIKRGIRPLERHIACSAAVLNYPDTQMDLVRVGILLYGYWPSPETFIRHVVSTKDRRDPLKRVIRWRSKVMNLKNVNTGEYVGYGSNYLAQNDIIIAVIPVGYSDGFNRTMSNHGRVLIHGQQAPVIGLVNMNMLIADVSFIPDVKRNDEVVLIGKQLEAEITVASFSEMSDRLNYEALVRLPARIKRIIVNE